MSTARVPNTTRQTEAGRPQLALPDATGPAQLRSAFVCTRIMKRKLPIPPETKGDDRATEMIRVCLAHNDLHVSLNLGMWKDAEDSEVDEREAWGFLLSDLTRHIANGMMQEYGWDYDATRDHIRASFLKNFDDKAGGVTGTFPDP